MSKELGNKEIEMWKNNLQTTMEDKFHKLDQLSNKLVTEICSSVYDQVLKYKMELCQDLQNPDFSSEDTSKCKKKMKKKFKLSMSHLKSAQSRFSSDLLNNNGQEDTDQQSTFYNKKIKNNMEDLITEIFNKKQKQDKDGDLILKEILCQQCSKPFSRVQSYAKHLQEVHMKKISFAFHCFMCPFINSQSSIMARHLLQKHSEPKKVGQAKQLVYICPRTGKQFIKFDQLDLLQTYLSHSLDYAKFEPKVPPLRVPPLKIPPPREDFTNTRLTPKKERIEVAHPTQSELDKRPQIINALIPQIQFSPQGYFICPNCQAQFVTTRLLAKHLIQEMKYCFPNYYFCPKCLEAKRQCQPIVKHLLLEHGKGEPPTYKCRYTDTQWTDAASLKKHLEKSYVYSTFFTELSIPINYFKSLEKSELVNE